jgi:hypothetical protein
MGFYNFASVVIYLFVSLRLMPSELLDGNETECAAFVKGDGFEELLPIPDV